MKNIIVKLSMVAFLSTIANFSHAETIVIVHKTNNIESITKDEVIELFLAKRKTLDNGKHLIPLDQRIKSDIRLNFYKTLSNKSESQLKSYWSRLVFTGHGVPPQVIYDDDEVMELVSENPNMIGYINASALDDSVKGILTIK